VSVARVLSSIHPIRPRSEADAVVSPAAPAAAAGQLLQPAALKPQERPATHGSGKRQKPPAFARNHGETTMIRAALLRAALYLAERACFPFSTGVTRSR